MIAPDANLLIYANHPTSPFHAASRVWLEGILSSFEPVGIPSLSIYAFLRFMTNPAIHPKPATFLEAAEVVGSWIALPHVRILHPGSGHWNILRGLGIDSGAAGNFITDAAIAAVALEHNAIVYTYNDRDFARFAGLRWHNPLRP